MCPDDLHVHTIWQWRLFQPRAQIFGKSGDPIQIVTLQFCHSRPDWAVFFQRGDKAFESGRADYKARGNRYSGVRQLAQRAALAANCWAITEGDIGKPADAFG